MKKLSSKITFLVSCGVHDNAWEMWLFSREFTIAAILNSSLLFIVLYKSLASLVELKLLATRK